MEVRSVVGRGVRVGARLGAWPAGILAGGCLVVAFVFLVGGRWGTVRTLVNWGVVAALASMAAGVVLGAGAALMLAVAPQRLLVRPVLRGTLAGLTAGLPLAALSVAFLSGDGYSLASYPPSIHVLTWTVPLVIALVVAAHSGEIAGARAAGGGVRAEVVRGVVTGPPARPWPGRRRRSGW